MFCFIPALLLLAPPAASDDLSEQMKRFVDVYAVVEGETADPIEPDKALYQGAIPGMLRRLDPHSVFLDPGQFQQLREMETSTRKGFGSIVSVLPGRVIVLQVLPGTPAQKAGLGPGDEILAVNGFPLARLEIEQIIPLLGEARQKQARLHVRKPGSARALEFTLTPEELQSPSVERAFLLKPGIGYVRVTSFETETGAQLKAAIEKLGGTALHGFVLDLRDNPGGVLAAALQTAALFLNPEARLLSVRGRAVQASQESVPKDSAPYTFPLAVLVNGKSASASEIVAGALQDHDRAVIVGETTFGKGLVQNVYPLSGGSGLALTTAYYYTPSGRSIQRPLAAAQIVSDSGEASKDFRTDAGRPVRGGGGIRPDFEVTPEPMTRFRMVLEANGAFTQFATDYVGHHRDIAPDFELTPAVLDEFQLYLSAHSIRPAVAEWSVERDWIGNRLKSEIFDQALGVERGDEVEAQRDPVILAALEQLGAPLRPAPTRASVVRRKSGP